MPRKIIGLFIAVCIGFLALSILGAGYAYQVLSQKHIYSSESDVVETKIMQPVKVFFGNNNLNPGAADCQKVFSITRNVPATQAIGRAALEELLSGPTSDELNGGYYTSLNKGVKINSLTIENSVAMVDFDSALEKAVGGSCRVAAIRAQITQTLLQFPTVRSVIISVDGRVGDALQP
jgi:spore germination protein GerM